MISRRALVLSGFAALICAAPRPAAAADDDPVAILTAVYTRVARGKGDGGGTFVFDSKAARANYLSTSFAELWNKADARTKKGDGGPVDFDPVTNSQDPDVKTFKIVAEKVQKNIATVAVTITAHHERRKTKSDETIRYEFLRESSGWKIDEIKGTVDGKPWSIRAILRDFFKY
jgi:hypothetical protein